MLEVPARGDHAFKLGAISGTVPLDILLDARGSRRAARPPQVGREPRRHWGHSLDQPPGDSRLRRSWGSGLVDPGAP